MIGTCRKVIWVAIYGTGAAYAATCIIRMLSDLGVI